MMVVVWPGLAALVVGCGGPEARAEALVERVVDSILPREEALGRFRDGMRPVDSLVGGASSLDSLVRRYLQAVRDSDTTALAALAVSRREFAWLYYPTATQARPPYDLEPGLLWFMLFEHSNQGIRRTLRLQGGRPMRLVDYDCGTSPQREGENLLHGPCLVRWTDEGGDTTAGQLFARILERGGRFKFLSYANRLE
jgi:hypothetical protein